MKRSGFKMKNPSIAKLAKAAGSPMRQDPTKIGTKESLTKPKRLSFDRPEDVDYMYKKRDMKIYGGLNKADYVKEAKRQKSVKDSKVLKKGGTYDVPKKPMVSKSGGAKTSVGTTVKTDVKKTEPKKTTTKKSNVMEGKKTLGQTKLGNLKVGKNGKRLADTKAGKAFSKARAKGVAERKARAERMAKAKAERIAKRKARREANKK